MSYQSIALRFMCGRLVVGRIRCLQNAQDCVLGEGGCDQKGCFDVYLLGGVLALRAHCALLLE